MDLAQLLVIALVGLAAGTVNTLAGGGSLITLPALIVLGVPAGVANGTNRVGVLFQSLMASYRFHRAGSLDWRRTLPLFVPTCLASTLGALASARIDDARFEQVIGVALLLMAGVLLVRPRRWLEDEPASGPPWARLLVFLGIGLYGGFLQAGVGVFLLAGLVLANGQELVGANASKSLLVAGFTVPPLVVFALEGLIEPSAAAALTVGSAAGAELGTRLALKRGAPLLRWALVAVVVASSAKLLWPEPEEPPQSRVEQHGLELIHRGVEGAPILIALHGRGDAPSRFAPLYEPLYDRAHVVVPQGLSAFRTGFTWFPTRAAGDPAELAAGVLLAASRVALLAESLVREGRLPVVTGFSQGGMISFSLAAHHPGTVRAAVPAGGFLPEGVELVEADRRPPVVAFHGAEDELVRASWAATSVELLSAAGWDAELHSYEGVGHSLPHPLRSDYLDTLSAFLAK